MTPQRLATVISVLGVILTAASVIASIAQYLAADLQAKAAIATLRPQVEVRVLLNKRENEKYSDKSISISSDGGPIFNFKSDWRTWFVVRTPEDINCEQPILHYYFTVSNSGRSKGDIQQIESLNNYEQFSEFMRYSRRYMMRGQTIAEPSTILKIEYTDSLRSSNRDYFFIRGDNVRWLDFEIGEKEWVRVTQDNLSIPPIALGELGNHEAVKGILDSCQARATLSRPHESIGGNPRPIIR